MEPSNPFTLNPIPTLATNRDAPYRYDLQARLEAGIILTGAEVKSVRAGAASLSGSYVTLQQGQPMLINCHIAHYPPSREEIDPVRPRALLLRSAELVRMGEYLKGGGLTVIPVSLYTKSGFIKVELALAKGKRTADRRQSIAKRETQRRIQRALRDRQRRGGA